jgi:steroid delta-isomerase-like uncharacterized protein
MEVEPRRRTAEAAQNESVIRQFYEHFNERRFEDAAAIFAEDAVLERAPLRGHARGAAGYLEFVHMWTQAFPDAALLVDRIASKDDVNYEIELLAGGTHLGALEMGPAGVFKPTGVDATLRMRQILEIRDGKIKYSSLSFDLQDLIHQLCSVDTAKLLDHLQKIHQLGGKLAATSPDDVVEHRNLIDRLGAELDAARRVVRPYFER